MIMAAVDPFSVATAELSEDFVKVFQDPDVISKCLEEVRHKTGVVVFVVDNCINIKGTWVSLNRTRSFLSEFLTSYQVAESEDKKDINLLHSNRDSESPPFSYDFEINNAEDDHKPASVPRLHDATGDPSDWIEWAAETSPQIQPIRSKRAADFENSELNSEANKIPEPLVLYTNYHPAPDPAAKVPPTFAAIEKVLKTVYDANKLKTSGMLESVPTSVISNPPTREHTLHTQEFTELNNQCIASVTNQTEVKDSVLDITTKHKPTPSRTGSHSPTKDDQEIEHIVTGAGLSSSSRDAAADKAPPLQTASQEHDSNPPSWSQSAFKREQSEEMPKRRSKRKSLKNSEDVFTDSGDASSVPELKYGERAEDSVTFSMHNPDNNKSTQSVAGVKGTQRKGRPRKNKKCKHQSETPQCEKQVDVEKVSLRGVRAAKCKSMTPVKAELGLSVDFLKKKPRRSHHLRQVIVDKGEDKGYFCELCPYISKRLSHLREHKRRVHITKDKEFKCEECGRIFGFAKDLKRHYITHQKAENKCDICGKMYKGVRTLAEHKKTHETDYIKPEFPCEFCQKVFSTKYVLAYHIKSEHLGMKKTYLCPTCGKSFSQKNSYLQHANVHMGIKPYQCDICGRSFSYEKSLKEHKFMHQDDKQFECPVCNKKFRQSSGVAIHMKIHKERKDYVCSACGKGFSQKQAMIRHERIHAGEKPFTCSLCQRSFTDSSILRRHMILIHKKDKDKWREDTETNVQRRTDFFISVVTKDGMLENGQASQQNVRNDIANDGESSLQALDKSASEPSGSSDNSCHTNDAGDFRVVLAGTVASMPQLSSLPDVSEMVVPATRSTPLPHCPQYNEADHKTSSCDSGIIPLESIDDPLTAVQSAVQKLDPDPVFGMSPKSQSSPCAQSDHVSSENKNQAGMQEEAPCVLNSYSLGSSNAVSLSDMSSRGPQQSASDVPCYPAMMAQGSADYHPDIVMMPDDLDSIQFHAESINVPSSQEQINE